MRKIEKRKTITALLLGLALSATAIQARNLTAKDTEKALAGILISINYQMKSLRIQLKTARTQMQIDWVKKDYEYFRKQIKHRLNKVGDTFPRASRYKQRRIQRDFKRLSRKFRNFKKEIEEAERELKRSANKKESANRLKPGATLVKYLNLLNRGRFEESLRMFAYDVLKKDRITLNQYKRHIRKSVTKNASIRYVRVIKEDMRRNGVCRVTVKIRYTGGKGVARKNLILEKTNLGWKLTSRGNLL